MGYYNGIFLILILIPTSFGSDLLDESGIKIACKKVLMNNSDGKMSVNYLINEDEHLEFFIWNVKRLFDRNFSIDLLNS